MAAGIYCPGRAYTVAATQAPIPETAKFLTQLGDFAFVVVGCGNGSYTRCGQRKLLQSFYDESAYLANELHNMVKDISDGQFRWSRIRETSSMCDDRFKESNSR